MPFLNVAAGIEHGALDAFPLRSYYQSTRRIYLLSVLPLQLVEQGVTPKVAMRVCNNPCIQGDALSRAIAKIVAEHT